MRGCAASERAVLPPSSAFFGVPQCLSGGGGPKSQRTSDILKSRWLLSLSSTPPTLGTLKSRSYHCGESALPAAAEYLFRLRDPRLYSAQEVRYTQAAHATGLDLQISRSTGWVRAMARMETWSRDLSPTSAAPRFRTSSPDNHLSILLILHFRKLFPSIPNGNRGAIL